MKSISPVYKPVVYTALGVFALAGACLLVSPALALVVLRLGVVAMAASVGVSAAVGIFGAGAKAAGPAAAQGSVSPSSETAQTGVSSPSRSAQFNSAVQPGTTQPESAAPSVPRRKLIIRR